MTKFTSHRPSAIQKVYFGTESTKCLAHIFQVWTLQTEYYCHRMTSIHPFCLFKIKVLLDKILEFSACLLPRHILKLFLVDPEVFPDQIGCIIPAVCSESASGSSSQLDVSSIRPQAGDLSEGKPLQLTPFSQSS